MATHCKYSCLVNSCLVGCNWATNTLTFRLGKVYPVVRDLPDLDLTETGNGCWWAEHLLNTLSPVV